MRISTVFVEVSCLFSFALALPQLGKQPTLTSCGNGRPVLVNATSSGVAQKAFILWTNSATDSPDDVLRMVVGAIEGAGGSVRSNLTVPATTFRGISAAAPEGLIRLIAEYGKPFGFKIEQDCIATIGPVATEPSLNNQPATEPFIQPAPLAPTNTTTTTQPAALEPQSPAVNATVPAIESDQAPLASSQPTTVPIDTNPALPPPSLVAEGPVVDHVLDKRGLPIARLPWLRPKMVVKGF